MSEEEDRASAERGLSLEQRLEQLALRQLEMHDVELGADRHQEGPFGEIPLRDQGEPAQLERVWGRLEKSLRAAGQRRRQRPLAAALAAAAVFALGVVAGRTTTEPLEPHAELEREGLVVSEPILPEERLEVREGVGRPSAAPALGPLRAGPLRAGPLRAGPRRVGPHRAELGRSSPADSVEPQREELAPQAEFPAAHPAPAAELPRWLLLADRGEYAAAFQAVDEAGGFDAVLAQSSAEELMTLADVARAAGQQGRAIQALRRVVQLFSDDPNAPVAAMMLGNLLHRAGDIVGAAEAYALNRSLSPEGDFAEDALAREFEVALETADVDRARALATQYEREFPQGRRLGDIREQLSRVHRQRSEPVREGARDVPRDVREGVARDAMDSADVPDEDPPQK